mmetsp:Transcript_23594/g.59984  ORF Transcript_23594/g.59984 Transcript_23594/m.59984 type:complete len:250 (-) Transcript_23594:319-1068(-)
MARALDLRRAGVSHNLRLRRPRGLGRRRGGAEADPQVHQIVALHSHFRLGGCAGSLHARVDEDAAKTHVALLRDGPHDIRDCCGSPDILSGQRTRGVRTPLPRHGDDYAPVISGHNHGQLALFGRPFGGLSLELGSVLHVLHRVHGIRHDISRDCNCLRPDHEDDADGRPEREGFTRAEAQFLYDVPERCLLAGRQRWQRGHGQRGVRTTDLAAYCLRHDRGVGHHDLARRAPEHLRHARRGRVRRVVH